MIPMSAPVFVTAQRIHNILKPTISQTTMTSTILSKLAETYPQVLKNPESILGPNALKVLEFWIYIEGLNDQEREEVWQRYYALGVNVRDSAADAACDAAKEVVGNEFRCAAWWAAVNVTKGFIFGYATYEIIGGVEDPIFYNLIMNHKNSSSV